MLIGKALFIDHDLDAVLRNQTSKLSHLVEHRYQGPRDDLEDAAIAQGIANEARVSPLQIDFENPEKKAVSEKVSVRDFGQDIVIDGVRATYRFKFTGDPTLFSLKPNTYTSMLPYGSVENGFITIGITGANNPDRLKQELERQVQLLKDYVGYQSRQIEEYNRQLPQMVLPLIEARRLSLDALNRLRDIL